MLNFSFEKSGCVGLLSFDGELTGERAGGLKEAIMISLDNAEHVVVDFEKVTKIDSICIKLIMLAYNKAKVLKKKIIFRGVHPGKYKIDTITEDGPQK